MSWFAAAVALHVETLAWIGYGLDRVLVVAVVHTYDEARRHQETWLFHSSLVVKRKVSIPKQIGSRVGPIVVTLLKRTNIKMFSENNE